MKKKIIISLSLMVLVALAATGLYFMVYKRDENNLTNIDKQWIEKNKNAVVDISIVNNIPVFNYNGEGVLFDFVEDIKKQTGLDFNKLSYDLGTAPETKLGFILTNEIDKNDVLVYKDNYVILSNEEVKYNNLNEINKMTLGVMKDDMEDAKYYLKSNPNIGFKEFNSYDVLFTTMKSTNSGIDGIVVPKLTNLKGILENEKLHIAYNITDMNKNLVLKLGEDKKLNDIVKKYLNKWLKEDFAISYNRYFTSDYFDFKNVTEQEKTNFKTGKAYTYGFVSNVPYDAVVNKKLVGIDYEVIKRFTDLTGVEVKWKEYKNIDALVKDFNDGKVDFFLDTTSTFEYNVETRVSNSKFNDKVFVLNNVRNSNIIKSLSSLKNETVLTVKDTKIENDLKEYNIDVKTYDRISKLLRKKKSNDIIAIDSLTYQMYRNKEFKNYRVDYVFELSNDYRFVFNNSKENDVFNTYLSFYIEFLDFDSLKNLVNEETFHEKVVVKVGPYLAIVALIIIVVGVLMSIIKKIKTRDKKVNISKEEKIKYIDALTSLKNRNYLNDSMSDWDESEIYPQAIVVIDLNNVAYINDNYGHEEGDNIIKEAAGILINNQIENTEIMRTNGNEFLIYMVDYDEKQVVTYIKKLNKDFKELSHGFGAAIGYSMITDAIKTIDDAINEATLDMKNNKEEAQG